MADFCDTHYCGPFEPDKLLEQVAKSVMTQDSASVEKGRHTAEQNENIISLLKQLHSHSTYFDCSGTTWMRVRLLINKK